MMLGNKIDRRVFVGGVVATVAFPKGQKNLVGDYKSPYEETFSFLGMGNDCEGDQIHLHFTNGYWFWIKIPGVEYTWTFLSRLRQQFIGLNGYGVEEKLKQLYLGYAHSMFWSKRILR